MTRVEVQTEALRLPVADRLELAERLWDSVEQDAADLPLHDWQENLLEERLADARQNPDAWLGWDEVKKQVLSTLANRPGR